MSFKFDEVQSYLTLTRHAYSALGLMMNSASFERLSAEHQAVVREVAAEAVAMQRQMAAERETSMAEELVARGMALNTDVDAAAFQAAVAPVWAAFIATNGDAEVNAIMAMQQ
jgi:TRAP-type C4-dicarboxylate transport system substrate-binding protein